jgi:hypothetical protein
LDALLLLSLCVVAVWPIPLILRLRQNIGRWDRSNWHDGMTVQIVAIPTNQNMSKEKLKNGQYLPVQTNPSLAWKHGSVTTDLASTTLLVFRY